MKQTALASKSASDPVCGMSVNQKTTTIVTTVKGQTYYFCAEGCRKSFVKTPEKYLAPKPAKKKGWWCRYTQRLEKATGGKSMRCH